MVAASPKLVTIAVPPVWLLADAVVVELADPLTVDVDEPAKAAPPVKPQAKAIIISRRMVNLCLF